MGQIPRSTRRRAPRSSAVVRLKFQEPRADRAGFARLAAAAAPAARGQLAREFEAFVSAGARVGEIAAPRRAARAQGLSRVGGGRFRYPRRPLGSADRGHGPESRTFAAPARASSHRGSSMFSSRRASGARASESAESRAGRVRIRVMRDRAALARGSLRSPGSSKVLAAERPLAQVESDPARLPNSWYCCNLRQPQYWNGFSDNIY